NPPTPVEAIEPLLDLCDQLLVMSVTPGFGGQAFQPSALAKLRRLRVSGGDRLLLGVDGGVNEETIGECARAGADLFVAGSALLMADDYGAALRRLEGAVAEVRR